MKQTLFLLLFILTAFYCTSQDLDYTNYKGFFEYSLLYNNKIYIPIRPKEVGFVHKIFKKSIRNENGIYLHFTSGSWNASIPYAWSIFEDIALNVTYYLSSTGQGIIPHIEYREFETRDSIELYSLPPDTEIKSDYEWITPLDDYQSSFRRLKRPFSWQEINQLMNSNKSFDINNQSHNLLQLYFRDTTTLFIWQSKIPAELDSNKNEIWQEVAVYTSPKTDFEYPPFKYSNSYSGTKTHINGITDSLFFDGHFKIIKQYDQTFIINREHALIYHMGEKAIKRIGKVVIEGDYPAIRGKKLFIEDRDNSQIIFFAPVTWEDNDLPKPRVRVMNEAEMKEKFKYVMD